MRENYYFFLTHQIQIFEAIVIYILQINSHNCSISDVTKTLSKYFWLLIFVGLGQVSLPKKIYET